MTYKRGWDMSKVASTVIGTIIVDGTSVSVKAPIPVGFTKSDIPTEDEISEGLVIYQGTDQVSTDEDAITTRNQFVWIPVTDINSMIMCKQNASGSICNIILEGGELKCTTHNTTGATNMCGRLYGGNNYTTNIVDDKRLNSTSMNFSLNTQIFSTASSCREPDIVPRYDKDANTNYFELAGMEEGNRTAAAFLAQLQNDFYAMAKSVALYKGFYISRYEAGYDEYIYTSKKRQTVLNTGSSPSSGGANTWYGLYKHLRTNIGILDSQMIWGCQYDQVIKFIKQNKESTELDPETGHSNIGLKTKRSVSGAIGVSDIMKNIYDLEGNCAESTAEVNTEDTRTARGNQYDSVKFNSFFPASIRGYEIPYYTNGDCTTRAGLYM